MRIFEHPNMKNFVCPICGQSTDKPVCLIGLHGTEEDSVIEAKQFHIECLDLTAVKLPYDEVLIAMKFGNKSVV